MWLEQKTVTGSWKTENLDTQWPAAAAIRTAINNPCDYIAITLRLQSQQHDKKKKEKNMSGKVTFEYNGQRVHSSAEEVTFDPSIAIIGSYAFEGCRHLEAVTIPTSIKSIREFAFCECTSLKSVTIPSSIKHIKWDAFSNCSSLTEVTIPSSVASIERAVFEDCTSLKAVTIPSSVKSIDMWAFLNCTSLTTINIPSSVTSIGEWAFGGCSSLTAITVPNSVVSIGSHAFADCSSLVDVNVSPLTQIKPEAFNPCPKLSEQSKKQISYQYSPPTLLQDTFLKGDGPKYDFKGVTQKGYGPEMCGITLQQLKEITYHPDIDHNSTMRDVVKFAIKPITKGLGICYTLLVNQKKPLRAKVKIDVSTLHMIVLVTTFNYLFLFQFS